MLFQSYASSCVPCGPCPDCSDIVAGASRLSFCSCRFGTSAWLPSSARSCIATSTVQDCNLYLCEAAALQKEMEMALIMNVAALKLCCKESKEDACAKQERRPWPDAAAGARLAPAAACSTACDALRGRGVAGGLLLTHHQSVWETRQRCWTSGCGVIARVIADLAQFRDKVRSSTTTAAT